MAFSWTSVLPWAVGEKIRAAKQNQAVSAIAELQTNATALVYDQTITSGSALTWTSNATRQLFPAGTFPSANGFSGSGSITTPAQGGPYLVSLSQTLSTGSFAASTRYFLEVDDYAGMVGHANAEAGASETVMSLFCVTRALPGTGGSIFPYRFQNTGSSITLASIRLLIVRLGTQ